MFTRRYLLALSAGMAIKGCSPLSAPQPTAVKTPEPIERLPLPDHYGAIMAEPFPIPAIKAGTLPPKFWRRMVSNPWPNHSRGTIVVDPDAAVLHFVENTEEAMRYGVSVGAAGFNWEGTARLQFWRAWPRWKAPEEMITRNPELEPYSVANGGMDPGSDNPLGARALYLFKNGKDTLYRIHGDAVPWELGRAVSSGCIRMLDHDVIDLQVRSVHGAAVIVLPSIVPDGFDQLY